MNKRSILLVGLGLVLGALYYNNRKRTFMNGSGVKVDPRIAECNKKGGDWDSVEHFCMP
jgi:hypothetical protein